MQLAGRDHSTSGTAPVPTVKDALSQPNTWFTIPEDMVDLLLDLAGEKCMWQGGG